VNVKLSIFHPSITYVKNNPKKSNLLHEYYRKKLFNLFYLLIKQGYLEEEFINIQNIINDCEMKILVWQILQ
jgi:hypothetical protein